MKIYLACPYSNQDPKVREFRFHMANRAAAFLMNLGHAVFSPISHSRHIDPCFPTPKDLDFWLNQDLPFLEWAEALTILKISAWENSKGIASELRTARELNKQIFVMQYHYDTDKFTMHLDSDLH